MTMAIRAIASSLKSNIKIGLLQGLALKFSGWFGTEFTLVSIYMLIGFAWASLFNHQQKHH